MHTHAHTHTLSLFHLQIFNDFHSKDCIREKFDSNCFCLPFCVAGTTWRCRGSRHAGQSGGREWKRTSKRVQTPSMHFDDINIPYTLSITTTTSCRKQLPTCHTLLPPRSKLSFDLFSFRFQAVKGMKGDKGNAGEFSERFERRARQRRPGREQRRSRRCWTSRSGGRRGWKRCRWRSWVEGPEGFPWRCRRGR